MTAPPLIISMHMEKCGGTSFEQVLREAYAKRFFLYDPGPPGEPEVELPAAIDCLHGHMFFGLHRQFPKRQCRYITLLRDPIERFISNFNHIRRYQHPLHDLVQGDGGFVRFCEDDSARHYRNLFVRRLSEQRGGVDANDLAKAQQVLSRFAVVGSLEHSTDFLDHCRAELNWQTTPSLPYRNDSPIETRASLSKEELALGKRVNAFDTALWHSRFG